MPSPPPVLHAQILAALKRWYDLIDGDTAEEGRASAEANALIEELIATPARDVAEVNLKLSLILLPAEQGGYAGDWEGHILMPRLVESAARDLARIVG